MASCPCAACPAHRCCHGLPSCVLLDLLQGARIIEMSGSAPGWWTPSATEKQMAAKLGAELLLVPGLTLPWNCTSGNGCLDLVVPKGWKPSATPSGRRRVLYLHGAAFTLLSPFAVGFPGFAMQLASRMGAPVLLPDYPLAPVGSRREQLRASLPALRWLAACACGWGGHGQPRLAVAGGWGVWAKRWG